MTCIHWKHLHSVLSYIIIFNRVHCGSVIYLSDLPVFLSLSFYIEFINFFQCAKSVKHQKPILAKLKHTDLFFSFLSHSSILQFCLLASVQFILFNKIRTKCWYNYASMWNKSLLLFFFSLSLFCHLLVAFEEMHAF